MAPVKTPTRRNLSDGQSGGRKTRADRVTARLERKKQPSPPSGKSPRPQSSKSSSKGSSSKDSIRKAAAIAGQTAIEQKKARERLEKNNAASGISKFRGAVQKQQQQQTDSKKAVRSNIAKLQEGVANKEIQNPLVDTDDIEKEVDPRVAEMRERNEKRKEMKEKNSFGKAIAKREDDEMGQIGFADNINKSALKRVFNDRSWLEFTDPGDLSIKYSTYDDDTGVEKGGVLAKVIYAFHLLLPMLFFLIPYFIHKSMSDVALEVGEGNRSEEDREEVRDDELDIWQKMWQKFSVRQRLLQIVFSFLIIFYGSRFSEDGAQIWRYYYFTVGFVMGVTYLISIFTDQGRGSAYVYLRDHVWPDNSNGAPIEEMKQTCIEFGCGYLPHNEVHSGIKCDEKNRGADVTSY